MNIELNNWSKFDSISIIGYAFHENNLLEQNNLADYFKSTTNGNQFKEKLLQLSGHFAVCIELENTILIAVDLIRTYPVFIQKNGTHLFIKNTITELGNLNKTSIEIFKKLYCTLDNQTLLVDTIQLQAGEFVSINKNNNTYEIKTYYQHQSNQYSNFLIDKLQHLENKIIYQLRQKSKDKTILLFLSGGYDSRYLLALCKKHAIKNIMCITYGTTDSFEIKYAIEIAKKLDYPIISIDYNDTLLNQFLGETWERYSDLNFNYTSLPHEQDFFALYYLKEKDLLPKNAIVINGFSQDLLAGSIFKPNKNTNYEQYIKHKYNVQIQFDLNNYESYQNWFIKNRVSKFIINSVHVYTFFSCDFYLPFWDKDWIQFWYNLKLEDRINQQQYNNYIFEYYFKPNKIDFIKPKYDSPNNNYYLRKIIRKILPRKLFLYLKNILIKKEDDTNTSILLSILNNKIKNTSEKKDTDINQLHALYILEKYLKK